MTFDAWLRRQIRVRRISQRALATEAGVDPSTISRLLRQPERSPTLVVVDAICRALGEEYVVGAHEGRA